MPGRKRKKTLCPFASAKKPKKRKSSIEEFSTERSRSLALSDRGLYYNQDEWLVKDTSPFSEAAEQQQKITEVYIQTFFDARTITTTSFRARIGPGSH